MDFDLDGVIEHVLSAVVIVGVAGWVARSWILHFLDKRTELYQSERLQEIETHKAQLTRQLESYKADLTHQLEEHKLKLQHENNLEMERLRSDLRPVAYAAEVRAAELLKRRAAVIAGVYRRLADAHAKFADIVKLFERSNEPPKEERAKAAASAGQAFIEYYDQRKVFLPEHVCVLLDDIRQKLITIWLNFTRYGIVWLTDASRHTEAQFKSQEEAWRSLEHEVPIARRLLEAALRALLGDTKESENAS